MTTALSVETLSVIDRVLRTLALGDCSAALVGACAVSLRSGVATRAVRDIDIYCRQGQRPIALLTPVGFVRAGENKVRWQNAVVDIVHPDLPRIDRVNRRLLQHCLHSQDSLVMAANDGTTWRLPCPTTSALLLLKLYSATRRTMWLTRRHDLQDCKTLVTHWRVRFRHIKTELASAA